MIKLKTLIPELFDGGYDYSEMGSSTTNASNNEFRVRFEALDGTYEVSFIKEKWNYLKKLHPELVNKVNQIKRDSYVSITFYIVGEGDGTKDMGVVPMKDHIKIFSTVINIIKEYVYDHEVLYFEAVGKSRVKLYDRMARVLGKDYDVITDADSLNSRSYLLIPKGI
jgi:hypothetical protein